MFEIKRESVSGFKTIPEGIDFVKVVEIYLKLKEQDGLAPKTIINYITKFKKFFPFLKSIRKEKNIETVNEFELRTYFENIKEYYKTTVYNSHVVTIRKFFKEIFERNIISHDPAKFLKTQKTDRNVKKDIYSDREIKLIIGSFKLSTPAEVRNLLIIMIFLDTGMRLNELISLNIENIDVNEMKVNFYAKKVKAHVEGYLTFPTLKVLESYKKHILKNKKSGALFLAINPYNQSRISDNRLSKSSITRLLIEKGLELDIKITPHKFRHTFATKYIQNGGDQFSLKELLGHSSLSSTDIYVNLAKSDVQKKHQQFNILSNIGGDSNE